MICIEEQYLSLNKNLLLAVGLWPYQRTKLVRFRFIFFLSILTTAILFQLTIFLTSRCTPDLIVKVLSAVLFFTTFVIKYISFAVNGEAVKDLLTQLQHVYNEIKDENENAIIEKYGYNVKRYTAGLTIFAACSVSALTIAQAWTSILDIVVPINVSRPHYLPILAEYFIDHEKYFFVILLHTNAAIYIGVAIVVATGTMLIAYLQLTYGMLKISSYRIERAMRINILQNISLKNESFICEGLVCAVEIHRQAMRLSELLVFKFEVMLFCLIAVGVISLSLNLFQLFQVVSSEDDIKEIVLPFLFVVVSILYMFIANYLGQDLMDHTNHIFVTVYNVQWYVTPIYIQRMILFLLQRRAKDFTLGVGGLFVGSLECFATLVKASVSYFTLIYSMR